jgi:hypothetical protein
MAEAFPWIAPHGWPSVLATDVPNSRRSYNSLAASEFNPCRGRELCELACRRLPRRGSNASSRNILSNPQKLPIEPATIGKRQVLPGNRARIGLLHEIPTRDIN